MYWRIIIIDIICIGDMIEIMVIVFIINMMNMMF